MASPRAIAGVLAYLHELYPTREIGVATTEAWAMTFREWDDATLTACAQQVAATPGRIFFPTPGEIAAARPVATVDASALLARISALGSYSPHVGWRYPRVETVRAALGEAIASAYAIAGAERCFADADASGATVTRDIARRSFATEMAVVQRTAPSTPLLDAPVGPSVAALFAGVQ